MHGFMDTYERRDLDAMVSFLAADAVYDEFNGTRNVGVEAVREAFRPQFEGAFGDIKFVEEDLFIDAATGKVMWGWRCDLEVKGEATSWRGVSLLDWNANDRVSQIRTYAKARVPLFEQ